MRILIKREDFSMSRYELQVGSAALEAYRGGRQILPALFGGQGFLHHPGRLRKDVLHHALRTNHV